MSTNKQKLTKLANKLIENFSGDMGMFKGMVKDRVEKAISELPEERAANVVREIKSIIQSQ